MRNYIKIKNTKELTSKERNEIYQKRWRTKNKNYHTLYMRKNRRKIRQELIILLGGACNICGFNDWRAMQVDHINGGGTKEIHKYSNPWVYYRKILREIKLGSKKYQLLCASCNQIKRYEKQEGVNKLD